MSIAGGSVGLGSGVGEGVGSGAGLGDAVGAGVWSGDGLTGALGAGDPGVGDGVPSSGSGEALGVGDGAGVGEGDGGAGLAEASGAPLPNLPALLAIGMGFAIGRILPGFSFGPTFAALFVVGGCVWAGVDIVLPFWVIALAFASIGAHVGLRVTPDLARTALRSLPAVVGGAALQILMCALLAVVIVWLTGVDAMSAMLSTVPGSIETIGYLAVVTDAAVPFVMTLQTVRLIGLTTIGPILAETLSRRFAPDTPSPCGSR